jgi:rare lipoprotein A
VQKRNKYCVFIALIFILPACSHSYQQPPRYSTHTKAIPDTILKEGKASYYGRKYHGRKTSNGERYHRNKFTAAHRRLPFGTVLEVTNLDNNQSVLVRINDRGPFVKGRIIDLSYTAAKHIGMIPKGVVPVKIQWLLKEPETVPGPSAESNGDSHDTEYKNVPESPSP